MILLSLSPSAGITSTGHLSQGFGWVPWTRFGSSGLQPLSLTVLTLNASLQYVSLQSEFEFKTEVWKLFFFCKGLDSNLLDLESHVVIFTTTQLSP